jgi:hypothetical protein
MSTAAGSRIVRESWQQRLYIQPEFLHASAVHVTQPLIRVPLVEIRGSDGSASECISLLSMARAFASVSSPPQIGIRITSAPFVASARRVG